VVAAIIGALFATQLPNRIGCAISTSVARIAGAEHPGACGKDGAATAGARDTDGDGVPDSVEQSNGSDPKNADSDGDGLPDGEEASRGSDPNDPDTDGDGVTDAEEAEYGTNPREADSDGDGLSDKEEVERGSNPRLADTDGDGLADGAEIAAGTDPFVKDTDGDGHLDGADDDPLAYDAGVGDIAAGAVCGDATWWKCPDDDDPVRASLEYFTGQVLVGLFAVGDVRDLVAAVGRGKWGDAAWSAAGIVPYAGDAAKIGKKIHELIKRFPGRRAELLALIPKLLPKNLEGVALDAATGGAHSALKERGLSDDLVSRLGKANDLKRIADNASLSERELSHAEATEIWTRAKGNGWKDGNGWGERVGVETALKHLEDDPNVEILLDGRPNGRRSHGPDILAVNKTTGRLIVVEAKGTADGSTMLGRWWLGTKLKVGGKETSMVETEPQWLRTNPDRYLDDLRNGTAKEQRAARLLEDINEDRAPYEVRIIMSRPAGKGGYAPGMDDAVSKIRAEGQVADLQVIDVQRPGP
jgi:hypothetical protein